MSHSPQSIASLFAAALDAEDYAAARDLLADNCVYHIDDAVHRGPDAILRSYRANGDSARSRFDEVHYFSTVEATGPSTAVIMFGDHLRLGERWHEYRCRQHIGINDVGLIVAIGHDELPRERERLEAFESQRVRRVH
jgi:hypothetical protein